MKKGALLMLLAATIISCESVEVNEEKIDSAGAKLQQSVESTVDTVVSTIDRWEDSLYKDEHDTLHRNN